MTSGKNTDFARVYEAHLWHVYAFLAYRLRDRDLAEDLTQSTFERALRAWPRFDPRRASERTWLLTIARNLLIDHHRREHPQLSGDIAALHPGVGDGPEAATESWPALDAALEQLSDREREIIALRFGADLSGAEIAVLTGLSLANVQQITSRSLRKLRALMEPASEPER